jgi:glycosyltransferase involved in cell wall biosynthesis
VAVVGTDVAGHYSALQREFERAGLPMNLFVRGADSPFAGRIHRIARWYYCPTIPVRRSGVGRALEVAARAMTRLVARITVPLWIALRHQAILVAYGNTWSRYPWELWLYRLTGSRVIVVFHGSDIRPPYLDGFQSPVGGEPDWQRLHEKTWFNHRRARSAEAAANVVVAQLGHCHFLTRPFVVFEQIGIPVAVDVPGDLPPGEPRRNEPGARVRVVHAPSSPATKGTQQIGEIITSLQAEGLPIEFVELVGRSNAEVVAALTNADLAVDQLWCDYPGGAFAVEAGLHGIPVIVGCNFLPEAADRYRNREMPPFLLVPPEDIKDLLRELVLDGALRRQLGRATGTFLRSERHPTQVAERYRRLIEEGPRPSELAHPSEGGDLNGGFAPRAHVHMLLEGMIERFGRSSLLLDDRSDLIQSIKSVTTPRRRP